ncbi:MAG: hypothetical protein ACOCTG_03400 [Bacteroidota bacterium]
MQYRFYLGIDADDQRPTAATLLEKRLDEDSGDISYHIHRLDRFAAETDVLEYVAAILADEPYVARSSCVVNVTENPSQRLHERLTEGGLSPIGVVVTGGQEASMEGSGFDLPGGDKAGVEDAGLIVSDHELVQRLINHETDGSLVHEQQQTRRTSDLAEGLRAYRMRAEDGEVALSGGETPERDVEHADLVFSTALALWMGDEHGTDSTDQLAGDIPTTGRAKRLHRPDISS